MRWIVIFGMLLILSTGCAHDDFEVTEPDGDFRVNRQLVRLVVGNCPGGSLPAASADRTSFQQLSRIASVYGKQLGCTKWKELVRDPLKFETDRAILLLGPLMSPQVLIDVTEFRGTRFALLSDLSTLRVVELTELLAGDFEWAIWADPIPAAEAGSAALRLQVGLAAEKVWASLGVAEPNSTVDAKFSLRNRSDGPVRIRHIHVGCTCVAVEPSSGTVVPAGETVALTARVDVGVRSIVHETAVVEVDRPGFASETVTLDLFGWSPGIMEIVPLEIDFGRVDASGAEATVRLVETPFDRFEVLSVKGEGVPVETVTVSKRDLGGLHEFKAKLRLDVSALESNAARSGKGSLRIATTSQYVPELVIPVRYELRQLVAAQPAYVDFGITTLNQDVSPVEVVLRHLGGRELESCQVIDKPETLAMSVLSPNRIELRPTFNQTGFQTEKVVLRAAWAEGLEDVEIRCSGLVTE